jgi:hypothetical protein
MTTSSASVVTPERFATGMPWADYRAYIGSEENLARESPAGGPRPDNSERFDINYNDFEITAEEAATLKSLPTLKMLVIGEDWCPDVFRGAPALAKIAETAGWESRFFQRDDNHDIILEFLNKKDGQEFESIPVAVLYTLDHEYVGHFIERPQVANEHMAGMQKLFTREDGESEDDMRNRIRAAYRELQKSDEWDKWRHATIDEIVELAKQAPGA